MVKGKIHSVESMGALDGPGIRYVLFLSGCPLRCLFCHNPDTWAAPCNSEKTADDVFADVMKYAEFFKFSKGGFTASGGEPLLQAKFLAELFGKLKAAGIHTALDTCGSVDITPDVAQTVALCDLFLFDIKHLDPEAHKTLTGSDNSKVLRFLDYIAGLGKKIRIRAVLLDSFNASPEYARSLAEFLKKYPTVEGVDILPYHTLGVHKWEELGLKYALRDEQPPSPEKIAAFEKILGDAGFDTTVQ